MVRVAAAFCLCASEAVITSPCQSNCLVLERKKVLNYTHPRLYFQLVLSFTWSAAGVPSFSFAVRPLH